MGAAQKKDRRPLAAFTNGPIRRCLLEERIEDGTGTASSERYEGCPLERVSKLRHAILKVMRASIESQ